MWNCRDQGLMCYHKRVLWASGEKILCVHDQQRSHRSFLINTSNTKQRICHNNPFCQHLEIISAKAPQKKKMLHLTASFHLQLQMSTNERQWLEIFGMDGPLKAWIIPQLTNKPVIAPFWRKKIQGYLHPSSHSSQKILWKLYQSLFSKWT